MIRCLAALALMASLMSSITASCCYAVNQVSADSTSSQLSQVTIVGKSSSSLATAGKYSFIIEFPREYAMQSPTTSMAMSVLNCSRAVLAVDNNSNRFQCSYSTTSPTRPDSFSMAVTPQVSGTGQLNITSLLVYDEQCILQSNSDSCIGAALLTSADTTDSKVSSSSITSEINMGPLGRLPLWLVILIGIILGLMLIGFGYVMYRNRVGSPEETEELQMSRSDQQLAPTGLLATGLQPKARRSSSKKSANLFRNDSDTHINDNNGSDSHITIPMRDTSEAGSGGIDNGLSSDYAAIPTSGSFLTGKHDVPLEVEFPTSLDRTHNNSLFRKKTSARSNGVSRRISKNSLHGVSVTTPSATLIQRVPLSSPRLESSSNAIHSDRDTGSSTKLLHNEVNNQVPSMTKKISQSRGTKPTSISAPKDNQSRGSDLTRKRSEAATSATTTASAPKRPPGPLITLNEPDLRHRPSMRHNKGATVDPTTLSSGNPNSSDHAHNNGESQSSLLNDADSTDRNQNLQSKNLVHSSTSTKIRRKDTSASRRSHQENTGILQPMPAMPPPKNDRVRDWANQMAYLSAGRPNSPERSDKYNSNANSNVTGTSTAHTVDNDEDTPLATTLARTLSSANERRGHQDLLTSLNRPVDTNQQGSHHVNGSDRLSAKYEEQPSGTVTERVLPNSPGGGVRGRHARRDYKPDNKDDDEDIPLATVASTLARQNNDDVITSYI